MSCPVCGSVHVVETDCYVADSDMYITYECDKCNSRWDEVWFFVGIEHLEKLDKEDVKTFLEQRDAWYEQRTKLKKEIEALRKTSIPKSLCDGWSTCSMCNGDVYDTDFFCSTCGAKLDWNAVKKK